MGGWGPDGCWQYVVGPSPSLIRPTVQVSGANDLWYVGLTGGGKRRIGKRDRDGG